MARDSVPTNGNALRRRRQLAGLSSQVFAERAGISKSFLSRVETGASNPSPEVLARIATALGVRTRDLVTAEMLIDLPEAA